jgi:hypothetical protein
MLTLLVMLMSLLPDPPATGPSNVPTTAPGPLWQVIREPEFAVAVPLNWKKTTVNSPAEVVYLVKQGVNDETGAPLRLGFTVERFPSRQQSLDEGARALVERFQKDGQKWAVTEDAKIDKLKLADGTEAALVTIRVTSTDGRRKGTQMKLMVIDRNEIGWVVGGYVLASAQSAMCDPDSELAIRLRAHVLSFCTDPDKLDESGLQKVYSPAAGK